MLQAHPPLSPSLPTTKPSAMGATRAGGSDWRRKKGRVRGEKGEVVKGQNLSRGNVSVDSLPGENRSMWCWLSGGWSFLCRMGTFKYLGGRAGDRDRGVGPTFQRCSGTLPRCLSAQPPSPGHRQEPPTEGKEGTAKGHGLSPPLLTLQGHLSSLPPLLLRALVSAPGKEENLSCEPLLICCGNEERGHSRRYLATQCLLACILASA